MFSFKQKFQNIKLFVGAGPEVIRPWKSILKVNFYGRVTPPLTPKN